MPALQRRVSQRGPRFYREGEALMFVHHLDGSTQIGPRVATEDDKAEHGDVLAAFELSSPGGRGRVPSRGDGKARG